jgi:hypothetical protein
MVIPIPEIFNMCFKGETPNDCNFAGEEQNSCFFVNFTADPELL